MDDVGGQLSERFDYDGKPPQTPVWKQPMDSHLVIISEDFVLRCENMNV